MPKGIPKGLTSKSVKGLNTKRTCNPINSLSGDIIRCKQLQKWQTKQLSTQIYPDTMTNSTQMSVGLNYRPKASTSTTKKHPGVKASQKKKTTSTQTRKKSLKANSMSGALTTATRPPKPKSSSSASKRTSSTGSSSASPCSYAGLSSLTSNSQCVE